MSKTYTPGPEVDAIVKRQVASGKFATGEDVVRAGVRLLQDQEAELEELRKLIDEGDADIAAGRVHHCTDASELTADIVARGEARSKKSA